MDPITIDITPVELPRQKPTKINSAVLELYDEHFRYLMDFMAEEPVDRDDPALGSKSVWNFWDTCVRRHAVIAAEVSRRHDEVWYVVIFTKGMDDLNLHFTNRVKAMYAYSTISKWILESPKLFSIFGSN